LSFNVEDIINVIYELFL